MGYRYFQAGIAALAVLLAALAGCGGGGSNPGDTYPNLIPLSAVTGPNSFLTFPNPLINASGVSEIDSAEYTDAYYAAIDPNNERDTFAKWKTLNGFDSGTGEQITVVVGDSRDLGYGRYITARRNPNGTMAFSVRNYLVPAGAGYGYSTLNLDAAIAQDNRWYIGASNIEFSPGPGCTAATLPDPAANCTYFAKFFFFAPDGSRARAVNLDGRGIKWMPGPCISCHGGRGDPLTPPNASGVRGFPLVQSSASLTRGDVQAHFHPLEADNFEYSTQPGYTRAAQEAMIKKLNGWILQSYPMPFGTAAASAVAEGRRVANAFEWQGTAAASLIEDGYGGKGLPNAGYVDAVPTGWASAGQATLYQNVVVPSCRVCHILRGMGAASGAAAASGVGGTDIDLDSYAKFHSYADQIKAHTVDRGNMPLAKIHYQKYWSTPSIYETMADYLKTASQVARAGQNNDGPALRPGRPIADAGPNRTVQQGASTLSGIASMFAKNYLWSISGVTSTATISNATSRDATFNATADGTYVVKLVVDDGVTTSDPAAVTIVVNNALTPAPSAIRFADIKAVLQTPGTCITCHAAANLTTATMTPVVYNNIDRNNDGPVDAIDDDWFYAEVRGRINFIDPADSALLLKPSGKHHTGLIQPKFDTTLPPGAAGRSNYDLFLNWILNGAPR